MPCRIQLTDLCSLQTQAELVNLNNAFPRPSRLAMIVQSLEQRYTSIPQGLAANVRNYGTGRDVPGTIGECRRFVAAAGRFIQAYQNVLDDEQSEKVVRLTLNIFIWFRTRHDVDEYAGALGARPMWAGDTNYYLFRSFCSIGGQPGVFMGDLDRIPARFLQAQPRDVKDRLESFRALCEQVAHGTVWVGQLQRVCDRKSTSVGMMDRGN
jgi:hypothetical protein